MSDDLSGMVPDDAAAALLLVDVINELEFEGADALLEPALAMAAEIRRLKAACREAGIPAIYANDNFGRWQSNFDALIERYLEDGCRGAPIIRQLLPDDDDYEVLKPKHSAFYASPLDLLLHHLRVDNLIIVGLTTDQCVTFTANDAYLREYCLFIPRDCVAAMDGDSHRSALNQLERVAKADTRPWSHLDLVALTERRGETTDPTHSA